MAESHVETAELAQAATRTAYALRHANQDASREALMMATRATNLLKFVAEIDDHHRSREALLLQSESVYRAMSHAAQRQYAAARPPNPGCAPDSTPAGSAFEWRLH